MSLIKQISFKALVAGSFAIIFLGLIAQLIFLLLATYFTELGHSYPWISLPVTIVSYIVGFFGYFIVMSIGGYIAANIADSQKIAHGVLIGLFTTGLSLFSSLNENGFTLMALIFLVSGTGFSIAGVLIWKRLHQSRLHVEGSQI